MSADRATSLGSGRTATALASLRAAATEWRWQLGRQRRALIGWSIALAAVAALYIPFYPAMGGADLQALIDTMPPDLVRALGYQEIGSPTGYLNSTIFGLLAPALLLVFAIGTAARTIAGDEEGGLLELAAAGPVDRGDLLAGRIVALHTQVALLSTVVLASTLVLSAVVGLEVRALGVIVASVALNLFIIAIGTVALAAGAVSGRRSVGVAAGAVLAAGAYIADTLAGFLRRGDLLERISPFAWYLDGDPIVSARLTAGHAGLIVIAFAAWTVAYVGLRRRDLGV